MINDHKLRQEMFYLLGMIEAACYPLACSEDSPIQAHYNLLDTIKEKYGSILKRTVGHEE